MKWLLSFFIFLILLGPIEVSASMQNTSIVSIEFENTNDDSLVPGDEFTETFFVQNLSSEYVRIRICEVSNEEDSKLFSVLKGRWDTSKETDAFTSLENLTTDWISLKPKETLSLPLRIYFPSSVGNEYQNAKLKAKFLFIYQISSHSLSSDSAIEIPVLISHAATGTISKVPSTADTNSKLSLYFGLCFGCILLTCLLHTRQKNQRSIHS